MGRFHHELVGKGGVLGFEERLAHGLVGSLFLGIYNEDTIFASTDTPNVGDHVGDVPETKLTERQQKKTQSHQRISDCHWQANVGDFDCRCDGAGEYNSRKITTTGTFRSFSSFGIH